jgi:hypothetical protein
MQDQEAGFRGEKLYDRAVGDAEVGFTTLTGDSDLKDTSI